jgi:hypothetical protein
MEPIQGPSMHQYTPKPHISPALAHLRHGVTAMSLLVALCAAVQMLVFGFVHFTEVRWVESTAPAQVAPLKVVSSQLAPAGGVAAAREGAPVPSITPVAVVGPERARQLGNADALLNTVSDLAVSAGVICAGLLGLYSMLGVVIAAGASVPGVHMATSGAMWAAAVVAACFPWHSFLSTVPFAGVFGPYSTMTALSDAIDLGRGSSVSILCQYLLMPIAAMCGSFLVLYRFRAGIAEGIIVTSVSELDERLEREMASIRNRGVEINPSARAVAALNHAIGEAPVPVAPAVPVAAAAEASPPLRRIAVPAPAAAAAGASSGRNWLNRERRMGQTDPGDPLKRPI